MISLQHLILLSNIGKFDSTVYIQSFIFSFIISFSLSLSLRLNPNCYISSYRPLRAYILISYLVSFSNVTCFLVFDYVSCSISFPIRFYYYLYDSIYCVNTYSVLSNSMSFSVKVSFYFSYFLLLCYS